MRLLPFTLSLLFLSAPAFATGGFDCQPTDGSNVALSGTVGHVVGAPLVGATPWLGERALSTTDPNPQVVIARSWIDEDEIKVDLADPQLERFEARLEARPTADGTAVGTLERDGRRHPVRCDLE